MGLATEKHRILRFSEAANYLRVSERTLFDRVQKAEVPHFRVGKLIRFSVAELEQWARNQSRTERDGDEDAD